MIGRFGDPTPMNAVRAEAELEAAIGWDINCHRSGAMTPLDPGSQVEPASFPLRDIIFVSSTR